MKNRILIIFISILYGALTFCQSPMYFATSAEGDIPIKLFPEKDGSVFIESIYQIDNTQIDFLDEIDERLSKLNLNKNFNIKLEKSTRTSQLYDVEIVFGHQPLGLDIMGSPIFRINRAATKVKFKCWITFRDGKFTYTLSNFETNRNTLRGEAKNDGEPNVIQWQRVNSLIKEEKNECKNLEGRKELEKLFTYNSQIACECVLYSFEFNSLIDFISNLENAINPANEINSKNTENKIYFVYDINDLASKDFVNNLKNNFKNIKEQEASFISFSKDRGKLKKIYISSGDNEYEIAGRNAIIAQIIIDGNYYVTSQKDEADFLVKYFVTTEGRDKAFLELYSKDGTLLKKGGKGSNESTSENRDVAKSLYKSVILKYQENE